MSTASPPRAVAGTLTPDARPPHAVAARPGECRNCGAALSGPFCAACGQRDAPADPTLRELLVELAENVLNVDGRVAATFRALVRRPGELTVEFLRGRRAPFLSPLRVYLLCSVLYFAVAAVAPDPVRTIAAAGGASGPRIEITGASDEELAQAWRRYEAMRRSPNSTERFVGTLVVRAMTDPAGIKRRFDEARPKMMFVLVPAFAALAASFFRRRSRYPAHLVFALHVHAFAFLVLVLVELAEAADRLAVILATTAAAWAAVLAYLVLAVRRVYEPRLLPAVGRSAALAIGYFVVLSLAQLIALVLMAALP